jgi:hypothetical protein
MPSNNKRLYKVFTMEIHEGKECAVDGNWCRPPRMQGVHQCGAAPGRVPELQKSLTPVHSNLVDVNDLMVSCVHGRTRTSGSGSHQDRSVVKPSSWVAE